MSFDRVPVEIIHDILEYVTASDLAALRFVNARLKDAVDGFPQYRQLETVHELDPTLLPKITYQHADKFYSPREILKAVTELRCGRCGNLSEIIYFPLMKRLCFYCFWNTDYSRLIRRYVAKEFYALSDEDLLSIPFFNNTPNGRLHATRRTTLNDTAAELLVKQKAMEVHGSLEQMQEMRRLEYRETQRQHWKSDPRQLLPMAPEAPEEKYEYWISVEKRYKQDVIHILGQVSFDYPPSPFAFVTCHLCVLSAHRNHQRDCPKSNHLKPRCSCQPDFAYELFGRFDANDFIAHFKSKHLEFYERYRDLVQRISFQKGSVEGVGKDMWEVQRMIRDIYGMGDEAV